MHAWKSVRAALVTAVAGATLVAVPMTAHAVPPSSAIEVGATSVARGQTFTVTQTVYNDRDFTIVGGKAGLYAKETSLPAMVDLVSCPGAYACDTLGVSVRGGVHDVPPGESRTVTFTFRVKDDAPLGTITLQHQFIGENYAFEILDGPALTITDVPQIADVAVSMTASVRTVVTARITYTVTVKNNGPADATGVRVVGTYPAGLVYAGSTCTRVGTTRSVNCDIASLASGASATRTFSADTGLLTVGSLTASAQRTASSPDDPVATNDKATRSCTAVTGLIVRC
ncbi:putative repeat protein (TIGR01451 family) [Kribbella sp. VKM Ac-2571]|nr:putative repeat protein (TIGR01451 family) [Kribbella sp. VKM Ac-2571]